MKHFSLTNDNGASTGKKNEDVDFVTSPVTTPTSIVDEEKCLIRIVPQKYDKYTSERIWEYFLINIPYLIILVSFAETIVHIESDLQLRKSLRFEPDKRYQIWRYLTYMLVHEDHLHLLLNVALQCIFAFFLEAKHGRIPVLLVYLGGGITGVLGASCLNPGLLIGASAGVYSLLISIVADLYLNYENTKYKICKSLCIAVIISSDITFNLYHYLSRDQPLISWEAHVFGGLTGLILGLALYKNLDGLQQTRKNICLTFSALAYFLLIASLVIITIDIQAQSDNLVKTAA